MRQLGRALTATELIVSGADVVPCFGVIQMEKITTVANSPTRRFVD